MLPYLAAGAAWLAVSQVPVSNGRSISNMAGNAVAGGNPEDNPLAYLAAIVTIGAMYIAYKAAK